MLSLKDSILAQHAKGMSLHSGYFDTPSNSAGTAGQAQHRFAMLSLKTNDLDKHAKGMSLHSGYFDTPHRKNTHYF